jgi:predicted O-methyltransferase YrrM
METLPGVEGPFDLVFIDADKPNIPQYFSAALERSHPGSVIIVDNVIRGGAVADPESKDASVLGVRRLNELIAAEPRVDATALQTVGSKGYDGLTFALVVA